MNDKYRFIKIRCSDMHVLNAAEEFSCRRMDQIPPAFAGICALLDAAGEHDLVMDQYNNDEIEWMVPGVGWRTEHCTNGKRYLWYELTNLVWSECYEEYRRKEVEVSGKPGALG